MAFPIAILITESSVNLHLESNNVKFVLRWLCHSNLEPTISPTIAPIIFSSKKTKNNIFPTDYGNSNMTYTEKNSPDVKSGPN